MSRLSRCKVLHIDLSLFVPEIYLTKRKKQIKYENKHSGYIHVLIRAFRGKIEYLEQLLLLRI